VFSFYKSFLSLGLTSALFLAGCTGSGRNNVERELAYPSHAEHPQIQTYSSGSLSHASGSSSHIQHPSYETYRLEQTVEGPSKFSQDDFREEAGKIVNAISAPITMKNPHVVRELEFEVSDKGYKLSVRDERGWLPEKYITMLNEMCSDRSIISYQLFDAEVYLDKNRDGTCNAGETMVKRPLAIVRKGDGSYCFLTYEKEDESWMRDIGLPFVNTVKCNGFSDILGGIGKVKGVGRTGWAVPSSGGRTQRNADISVKTSDRKIRLVVPYVTYEGDGPTVWLDEELWSYLGDDRPKGSRLLANN
jgi:hypothetical protein